MVSRKLSSILLSCLAGTSFAVPTHTISLEDVFFRIPEGLSSGSVHNIHISYGENKPPQGQVEIVYGDCASSDASQSHHQIASILIDGANGAPDRLVWSVPTDAAQDGCLHAYSGSQLVGRSQPVSLSEPLKRRETLQEIGDSNGLWFDGVKYLKSSGSNPAVDVEKAKSKSIAIVGAGMSGLMTSLLLSSVGVHNWHIIESTERLGGRVRTKYLNGTEPADYQYQEMGPMRFPVSIKYTDTNETLDIQDHKMVFQLANTLNKMNGDHPDLTVKFIPWTQSNPNTPANSRGGRLPNGQIPSSAQIAADPSLRKSTPSPDGAEEAEEAVDDFIGMTPERMRNISTNIFKAHREAIDRGLFQWSETAYLRYELGLDADTVDALSGSENTPLWGEWYDTTYFGATTWRTIDKGLNSLPTAFGPHVQDKITYGRKIDGLAYDNATSKVSVQWRDDDCLDKAVPKSEEYDYAVVAVPFSKVRLWRTPSYSRLLSSAISTLNYAQSCKVALHYETRFWEHLEEPILGGCGSADIPGIGNICYPSYNINATGPGVILGSYVSGTMARSLAALSEKDHVALVQRAMVEAHGKVADEQFTGVYERQCWEVDEHQAGAWAAPTVGQQELFIPAYHATEYNTVFVGEHTSITHAWIFSALESAVRGTTQLLLELGLVDEAKEIVDTWMARWITV